MVELAALYGQRMDRTPGILYGLRQTVGVALELRMGSHRSLLRPFFLSQVSAFS